MDKNGTHHEQDPQDWVVEHPHVSIRRLVSQLAEFGEVQAMVSHTNARDETMTYFEGSGNWHARVSMARQFIRRADAISDGEIESEFGGEAVP